MLSHFIKSFARFARAKLGLPSRTLCTLVVLSGVSFATPIQAQSGPVFPEVRRDFSEYRSIMRHYLAERDMLQRSAADVELNLPFERLANPDVPYQGKFLLFHGLNDSTYVWHDLSFTLASLGFDVRAILFKGHGSTPKDMLNVSSDHWLRAARRQLDLWWDAAIPMHIGGFSMGAVIATLLALDQPDLSGLLLISPAFHSKLNKYLRWSGISKNFKPWIFGGMILEDNPIKYNSIPVNSGYQFFRLTEKLKSRWKQRQLNVPTLMVATLDDSVVDVEYSRRIFNKRFDHSHNRFILYGTDSSTPLNENELLRQSSYPSKRILSQSHLGLMYRSDNTLFGETGDVLVCNGNEYAVFMACMLGENHWFGAQHAASPDGVPVARTTYNADWGFLSHQIELLFAR